MLLQKDLFTLGFTNKRFDEFLVSYSIFSVEKKSGQPEIQTNLAPSALY